MVTNKITEGVGKKIVEALKQQADVEIQDVIENPVEDYQEAEVSDEFVEEQNFVVDVESDNFISQPMQFTQTFADDVEEMEIPTNIAVLKQLINQLPAGVSRQTGAQIIKQTMEALGISMKSVLQEAQQVQENLNIQAKECQTSIMEHRKQIGVLERQAQKYQKQYSSLNDIISLFVQTNI